MIVDIECSRCNGLGELVGGTPSQRARFVLLDDLDPDDYADLCPKCGGSGTVEYDPEEEMLDE